MPTVAQPVLDWSLIALAERWDHKRPDRLDVHRCCLSIRDLIPDQPGTLRLAKPSVRATIHLFAVL
jgi:hypothetical protein